MIVTFNEIELDRFMKEMSSWEKLSEVIYNWDENELSMAFSIEKLTRDREHILKRLVGRYNKVRSINLDDITT